MWLGNVTPQVPEREPCLPELGGEPENVVTTVVELLLVALVIWGLWTALRPRPQFVVRIADGVPRVGKGKVPPGFLQDIGEVCARHRVSQGEVRGVAVEGRRIALKFSGSMPEPCRQQLRNLWNLSGWSSGPRQARG